MDAFGIERRADLMAGMIQHHAAAQRKLRRQAGRQEDPACHQRRAALRACPDVAQRLLGDLAVVAAHELLHWCYRDTVLELHAADLYWREQVSELARVRFGA